MRFLLLLSVATAALLLSAVVEGRRGGGGGRSSWGGGRSSSSRSSSSSSRSSWFSRRSSSSRPSSSSSSSSSSYPKQQWGTSSSGSSTAAKTPIGGGGFVKPGAAKPAAGAAGTAGAIGGGGFAKPSAPSLGTMNSGGSKVGGFGSHAATGGVGALGGFAAGKLSNGKYGYPKQKSGGLSSIFKKKPKTMSSPGYGTAWGTKFGADTKYKQKKGFSKKALGLGVAAGFVGGAAVGVAGTMATYSVYHRYQNFKNMMRSRGFNNGHRYGYDNDYDDGGFFGDDYYKTYYNGNQCMGGCWGNSHCEYGFCECDYGYQRRYGRCGLTGSTFTPRAQNFDPFVSCADNRACQTIDLNMVCNTKLTTSLGGKCQCKPDMRWNKEGGECQLYVDVDCSAITYDTPPSKAITDAVAKAQAGGITPPPSVTDESSVLTVPTIDETISSSLLSQVDSAKASEAELREAYCRDVDSFSFDMNVDDGRPPKCEEIRRTACGVVYDSGTCRGGWKLYIGEGEISFPYFSSYWKYRNDIDLVGVKAGCTLTAFSSTGFSGKRGTFRADSTDGWWRLKEFAEFLHLHEDIESIQCVCRNAGR